MNGTGGYNGKQKEKKTFHGGVISREYCEVSDPGAGTGAPAGKAPAKIVGGVEVD